MQKIKIHQVGANLKGGFTKLLLIIPIAALLYSCVNPFAPHLDENLGEASSIISDRKEVLGVFQNMRYAYTFKDTSIYGELLNKDFTFVYRDYEIGADVSWGKEEEMKATEGLFRNSERLDLIWNNIVAINEDSTNIIRSFNLTITFNPTDVIYIDGRVNMDLKKDDEGKWQILRWVDESNY